MPDKGNPAKHHAEMAVISSIGLITCTVIAGELLSDVLLDTSHFPQVPAALKPLAIVVFLGFAGLEASKVRSQMAHIQGRRVLTNQY
ncbi:hypothetical protein LCGC14_1712180 [marine sediment metagenome]|uniref:Uncharacterized protein n=1 Tax=marine sediment metagenome TaxID=412755 RepID=A0A0F9HEI3_9ZZZZ